MVLSDDAAGVGAGETSVSDESGLVEADADGSSVAAELEDKITGTLEFCM